MNVGAYTYGAENITVHDWGEGASLTIGKFCSIAASVAVLLGGNHRTDLVSTYPFGHRYVEAFGGLEFKHLMPYTNGDVVIGNDVWIGQGATFVSGSHVGDGAVIAANAHVSGVVEPYTIVGGNPARKIRNRFPGAIVELLLKLRWWDLPEADIKRIVPELMTTPNYGVLAYLVSVYRS